MCTGVATVRPTYFQCVVSRTKQMSEPRLARITSLRLFTSEIAKRMGVKRFSGYVEMMLENPANPKIGGIGVHTIFTVYNPNASATLAL
jgi:hypothetical protein